MNCLRLIPIVLTLIYANITVLAQTPCDSMLRILDMTIASSSEFEKEKELRIDIIKNELKQSPLSLDDRHSIYRRLYDEYESYICDSARAYINRDIELARKSGRQDWLNYASIKKARILSTSGLFTESIDQIRSIDRKSL